ncbi:hypothetical protein [Pseudomonas rubra]|uniref:Uncharacterized protein n=1 Tax=Pseudomonas rubra TaxID=2942627 RepID=A0ABT5PCQ0_9PSED|nr:hypothetical protein [Pseudomonas rubra]MDD1016074.1 hypothetical protein [Pseudomonas rubra]MDD1040003.1 hypothetical protein [Pseudomonas rubra]MDD1156302.1 hypothetical protein [Pseudomonas rubra]
MIQEIVAQFNSGWAAAAAFVGMLFFLPTRAIKLINLYDSLLVRRQYKILKELRAAESSQSPYAQYLDDAIYLESFRIASGVRADRTKADFLIRLARTAHWNNWQIRQIARFLWVTPEQPRITLRITAHETTAAWSVCVFGFLFMGIGCITGLAIMLKGGTFSAFLAGAGVEVMFIFGAALIMSPYNSYRAARRFQKYLETHPEILDEVATTPSGPRSKSSVPEVEDAGAA